MQAQVSKMHGSSGQPGRADPIDPELRTAFELYPRPREHSIKGITSPLSARLLCDGSLGAICTANQVQVYNLASLRREYVLVFENSDTSAQLPIVALCELTLARSKISTLLIAVDDGNDCSQLHVVELRTSRRLAVINVPYAVTCLQPLEALASEDPSAFKQPVAVGTVEAHLLILDLDIDIKDTTIQYDLQFVKNIRDKLQDPDQAVRCYDVLGDKYQRGDNFAFAPQANVPLERATVTALATVPGSPHILLVGFGFGAFHIWRLADPASMLPLDSLIHASPLSKAGAPVTHLVWQQPDSGDPTSAFLWVLTGAIPRLMHNATSFTDMTPVASVYELAPVPNADTNLVEIIPRVELRHSEHVAASSSHSMTRAGRFVACYLSQSPSQAASLPRSMDSAKTADNNFAIFFWESLSRDLTSGTMITSDVHCATMDLSAALNSLRLRMDAQGFGKWQHYKLNVALPRSTPLLDVAIDPISLSQYAGLSFSDLDPSPKADGDERRVRKNQWPLSFSALVLSKDTLYRVSYLSPQQTLMQQLASRGPISFEKIDQLHAILSSTGVLAGVTAANSGRPDVREALFDVALLNGLASLLCAYPLEPAPMTSATAVDGFYDHENDFSGVMATSPFLLATPVPLMLWAQKRVQLLQNYLTVYRKRLLALGPVEDSDEAILRRVFEQTSIEKAISMIRSALQDLGAVFEALEQRLILQSNALRPADSPMDQLPPNSLHKALNDIQATQRGCEILIWMSQQNLLQVYNPTVHDKILRSVKGRRSERRNAFAHHNYYVDPNTMQRTHYSSNENNNNSFQQQQALFIDLLVAAASNKFTYPPEDFDQLLRMYSDPAEDGEAGTLEKHLVFLYWLHDLLSCASSDSAEGLLQDFCAAFFISRSQRKLIRAFWLLDNFTSRANRDRRGAHSMPFAVLSEPDVTTEWILHAVRALRDFGVPHEALALYRAKRAVPHHLAEGQLVCEVLLANGLLAEAFLLQRRLIKSFLAEGDSENLESTLRTALFGTILAHCGSSSQLEMLFQLPLDSHEYELVEKYLQNITNRELSTDLLLVLHLQRNQYQKAVNLYDTTHQNPDDDNSRFRKALIDNAIMLIPPNQRKTVVANRPKHPPTFQVPKPIAAAAQAPSLQLYPKVPAEPMTPSSLKTPSLSHMMVSPLKPTPMRPALSSAVASTPGNSRLLAMRSVGSPTVQRTPPPKLPASVLQIPQSATPARVPLYPQVEKGDVVEPMALDFSDAAQAGQGLADVPPSASLSDMVVSVTPATPATPARTQPAAAPSITPAKSSVESVPIVSDAMAVDSQEKDATAASVPVLPPADMMKKIQESLKAGESLIKTLTPAKPAPAAAQADSDSDDVMIVDSTGLATGGRMDFEEQEEEEEYDDMEDNEEDEEEGEFDDSDDKSDETGDEAEEAQGTSQVSDRPAFLEIGGKKRKRQDDSDIELQENSEEEDNGEDENAEEEKAQVPEDIGANRSRRTSIALEQQRIKEMVAASEADAEAEEEELQDADALNDKDEDLESVSQRGGFDNDVEMRGADEDDDNPFPPMSDDVSSRQADAEVREPDAMEVDQDARSVSSGSSASSIGVGAIPSSLRKQVSAMKRSSSAMESDHEEEDEQPEEKESTPPSTAPVEPAPTPVGNTQEFADSQKEEDEKSESSRASRRSTRLRQAAEPDPEPEETPAKKAAGRRRRGAGLATSRGSSQVSSRVPSDDEKEPQQDTAVAPEPVTSALQEESSVDSTASRGGRPVRASARLLRNTTPQATPQVTPLATPDQSFDSDASNGSRPRRGRNVVLTAAAKRPTRTPLKSTEAPAPAPEPALRKQPARGKQTFTRARGAAVAAPSVDNEADSSGDDDSDQEEQPHQPRVTRTAAKKEEKPRENEEDEESAAGSSASSTRSGRRKAAPAPAPAPTPVARKAAAPKAAGVLSPSKLNAGRPRRAASAAAHAALLSSEDSLPKRRARK